MASGHVELGGSNRPAARGATRVRNVDPDQPVTLTLTLRGPALPSADAIPDPGLTAEQFAAAYGADQADVDRVAATMTSYGFTIDDVSLPTRSMRISGTVGQVEAAFRPRLAIYSRGAGDVFRGREGAMSVPADVADIVTGVFGVDERRVTKPRHAPAAAGHASLTPGDLERRYRFPEGDAAGQKVAIAEFGGGYFASDVTAFCTKYGVPDAAPNISAIDVGHPAYTLKQIKKLPAAQREEEMGAAGEVMMDVEIIAALCPAADISVYFGHWSEQGWVDLLNAVLADRPVALSISWGQAERSDQWSPGAITAIDERLAALATQGVTVCVSSGDDGSGDLMFDDQLNVDYPASSAFVLGVGGTEIVGDTEQTWWTEPGCRFTPEGDRTGGGATGGGVSAVWPRPGWQDVGDVTSGGAGAPTGRVVPDVAALAGPPFYDLIFTGRDAPNGGTSASAPLWAALIARVEALRPAGSSQRFLTPVLYRPDAQGRPHGATACQDIDAGHDNSSNPDPGRGYAPDKGYDAVTGWGTPDGEKILQLP